MWKRPNREDVTPGVDDVLAGEGCDPAIVRARGAALLEAAERALEVGAALLEPAFEVEAFHVQSVGDHAVALCGGTLDGTWIAQRLSGAAEVVIGVATVGRGLETLVSRTLPADPVLGLALDGLGNAALSRLMSRLCDQWATGIAVEGDRATPPLSPGLGGWPLDEGQRDLFRLVAAEKAGIVLTESFQMLPRKSVSFVVGIGAGVECTDTACAWCSLGGECRYRPAGSRVTAPDRRAPGGVRCVHE